MLVSARYTTDKSSYDLFVANNLNQIVTRMTTRMDDLESYHSLLDSDVDMM